MMKIDLGEIQNLRSTIDTNMRGIASAINQEERESKRLMNVGQ